MLAQLVKGIWVKQVRFEIPSAIKCKSTVLSTCILTFKLDKNASLEKLQHETFMPHQDW